MIETLIKIRNMLTAEDGQALAEYALILGSIALACIVAAGLLGVAVTRPLMDLVNQGFPSAGS